MSMVQFKVIEHMGNNDHKSGDYRIIAINFLNPTYVKISSTKNVEKGDFLEVEGSIAYLNKTEIGKVMDRRDGKSIRVNTTYDIKYTGGYSLDGKTVYLDEHFPTLLNVAGKTVDARETIGLHHELPEKWLSDDAYEYPYAHEIATGIEKEYVEYLGVSWKDYCNEVDKNLRKVYRNKLKKSPASLDLAPYLYCRDREALKEIRESSTE